MDIFLVIFWPFQSDNMDKNEPREKMYPDIDMENVLIVVSDVIVFRKLQVYIIQLYKILVHLVGDKQRLFMILKLLKIMNLLLKLEILLLLLKRQMQIGGKVNSMGKQVNIISRNRW